MVEVKRYTFEEALITLKAFEELGIPYVMEKRQEEPEENATISVIRKHFGRATTFSDVWIISEISNDEYKETKDEEVSKPSEPNHQE